jgi:hypothetical protein
VLSPINLQGQTGCNCDLKPINSVCLVGITLQCQGRIQTIATVVNATVGFSCKNIFNTECHDSKNSL